MLKDRLSLFFVLILLAAFGSFMYWGLDYTNHSHVILFTLATIFGLFMAFNIGGNDVANSFGTSVGAGTLTIRQALFVAAIFEVSGAMIAGGAVTDTIRKGIVDLSTLTGEPGFDPMDFVYIMMSALFAAALWLLIATKRGWPVSTTHSIIGGIVGASLTLGFIALDGSRSLEMVHWGQIGTIALSWVISPVLGGLVAYILFCNIKKYILNYNDEAQARLDEIKAEKKRHKEEHKSAFERMTELQQISYTQAMVRDAATVELEDRMKEDEFESDYYRGLARIEAKRDDVAAFQALQTYVPLLAALGAMIITAMLLFKGLKHMHLGLSNIDNYLIIAMVGAAVWMAIYILARTLRGSSLDRSTFLLFSWMQVFTASGFAFSHGSNDIANAIGPFAAVLDVLHSGDINAQAPVPPIAMLCFGVALIAGLWFIGKNVIATVGTHLTKMHPSSGFAAELSAAAVVIGASSLGIPVSSTHILVGAVLGIGICNSSANWNLMKPIAMAWVITLPAAALIGSLSFVALRAMF
ncbi:MAG: inorganic phosphate transporter [Thiohalocapsa sp. PB-PSB1]|jgi:PiT family inorganic phosphate transporter|nr:MAG: inorganic phosphate transporter [Thiohalocapsa sp. PB-PSB1]HCS90783.1 phosphate permease [Chromatiaceae bacterium]